MALWICDPPDSHLLLSSGVPIMRFIVLCVLIWSHAALGRRIEGDLVFRGGDEYADVTSVGGNLWIDNNNAVTNVDGLSR